MVNRQSTGMSKALTAVHPVNILVVDDNPAKLLSYEAMLDVLGENLIRAGSGREALKAILSNDVAVILVDVCMPELDGFQLAALIRDHPRFQHTAIIFISAIRLADSDKMRGYQLGAVDYVEAPVVAEVLRAKVRIFTELHRKTRQLEKLNSDLEQRVSKRTAELQLSTERLRQSEQRLERRVEARTTELEAVNRHLRSQIEQREIAEAAVQQLQRLDAIGQITSGVAHDFNNLLSVVLINARLLSRNLLGSDDQEGVELIRASAERGVKLTAQLLAFSRQQRLEPQVVDLNAKIAEMGSLLRVTLGGAIQFKTALAPQLWPALVDPTQIELIVLNLVINARDAMRLSGTLILETSNTHIGSKPVQPEDPPLGDYVALAVNDTGTGIRDDVLPHVFEPFFTTKETGKGSGLGLSQVFGFAKQSGGGVRIETRVGEGTSVKVFLPRAKLARADEEMQLADAQRDWQVPRKLNVLVVDDDTAVLKSVQRMLDFLGHAAVSAASGGEALRLIASEPDLDLVLADCMMPEIGGVELARTIRTMRPTLPVILVTGYGDLDLLKEFDETRILLKPYSEDDLVTKINAARS
jgi:signal transduction histidine kinase